MSRLTGMVLALILVMALALPAFTGCGGKPLETPTEQELPQILDDALLAVENAGSYKFTIDASTVIKTTESSELEDMTASLNMTGAANKADNETQIDYVAHFSGQLFEFGEGLEEFNAKIYSLSDWTYMWTDMYKDEGEWSKVPSTGGVNEQYNIVEKDLKLFASPDSIEFLRYEKFDGSQCYVLEIVPNTENAELWFYKHQMTTTEFIYWTDVENKVVENVFTIWIDTDSKLVKKTDAGMLIDFTEEPEFDTMTLDVGIEMKDYNKPVSIVLPDEAQNAGETG